MNELSKILASCLKKSELNRHRPDNSKPKKAFHAPEFFKRWFRDNGRSYYFVFRKNLSVTNIQFEELLSLIRANITSEIDGRPIENLHFSSVDDFQRAAQSLVDAFAPNGKAPPYLFIAATYLPIFEKRIVTIAFHGSCAVFIPPKMKLNLERVCAYSGYINFCGKSIYIRRIAKARDTEFLAALREYATGIKKNRRVFFTVYAHEDFRQYDAPYAQSLANGPEDLRIHLEKYYMDKVRLVSVVNRIRLEFSDKFFVPNPRYFREENTEFRKDPGSDGSKTVWLVADSRIDDHDYSKGIGKYYICYEQLYKNENQFQSLFDENKPAWIAPITIPHTLIASMINIALPAKAPGLKLVDPFLGTGTTWLEASKYPRIRPSGSDSSPSTIMLVEDNLRFFTASPRQLREFQMIITGLVRELDPKTIHLPVSCQQFRTDDFMQANLGRIRWLREEFFACFEEQIDIDIHSFDISQSTVSRLHEGAELLDRLLFYLSLRVFLKNIGAYHRRTSHDSDDAEAFWNQNIKTPYIKELELFLHQIERLIKLKNQSDVSPNNKEGYTVYNGRYSRATAINFRRLRRLGVKSIRIGRAEEIIGPFDLIITDPPYGFNTNEDLSDLAAVYTDFLRASLESLKDNGQIVICLPEISHTGRKSPFFTHKEVFTKQLLSIAEDLGLEVVLPGKIVPNPKNLYSPPYYWESERALRRTILHFRVRMKRRTRRKLNQETQK